MGRLTVERPGRDENYRFSCAVHFESGRVRTVEIDPRPYVGERRGYGDRVDRGGRGGSASSDAALQGCERAVEDRIHNDGYRLVEFESINVDDNPGRNDWVVGTLRARQSAGSGSTPFTFSCSVNLENGVVRSVDVRRR